MKKNEIFYDEALILKKNEDFFIGISKNYGKVFFSSAGISKKYSGLSKNFYIKYNLEKVYNSNKKIIIYPDNINLESYLLDNKFFYFSDFINFILLEFHLSGFPNEKIWNILSEIKDEKKFENILEKLILIFIELCDFLETSFLKKILNNKNYLENLKNNSFLEIKYLFEKDLEKIFDREEKIIFGKKLLSNIFNF